MGGKRSRKTGNSGSVPANTSQSEESSLKTTSQVSADPSLNYKLRVLIHDLLNITNNPAAATRLNNTTDEYYISMSYFTPQEALLIKNSTIDTEPDLHQVPGHGDGDGDDDEGEGGVEGDAAAAPRLVTKPVHEALSTILSGFLEKRRASGDARPCGPHHLAPLYAALFGVALEELQDAKFLGRFRRNGI